LQREGERKWRISWKEAQKGNEGDTETKASEAGKKSLYANGRGGLSFEKQRRVVRFTAHFGGLNGNSTETSERNARGLRKKNLIGAVNKAHIATETDTNPKGKGWETGRRKKGVGKMGERRQFVKD